MLSLHKLAGFALAQYHSSLTVANAGEELFSDTLPVYPELAKVVLDFVAENWSAVQKSAGYARMQANVENGAELSTSIALGLMQRLK